MKPSAKEIQPGRPPRRFRSGRIRARGRLVEHRPFGRLYRGSVRVGSMAFPDKVFAVRRWNRQTIFVAVK